MAKVKNKTVRPEQIMVLGFLILVVLGSLLLTLPAATVTGRSIGLARAIFTATSAVSVTGLVTVDTGTTFSVLGQVILLGLIQIGGLGFMALATMLMRLMGRRTTMLDRQMMRESVSGTTYRGVMQQVLRYAQLALLIEFLGAALLAIRFVPAYGWGKGLWFSLFHAVSAFCNAGFDLFGNYSSLTGFSGDPLVLMTVILMITTGGIGYAVIMDIFRQKRMSVYVKLVLVTSAVLTVSGWIVIGLLEWNNPATLGGMSVPGKLLNALFQSVTMRTAGFNSVDLGAMSDPTKLVCCVLMFIGASPASTGGGVKTTTIAILMLTVMGVLRGQRDTEVYGRRIAPELVRRALVITAVSFCMLFVCAILTMVGEHGHVSAIDLLFESSSAVATVGVSAAGTPGFSVMSRVVLVPVMFCGRVGPVAIMTALTKRMRASDHLIRRPEIDIMIG